MNQPVKSAARTIDVLELLAAHEGGLTLQEIADRLGMAKSSTHGLLTTLLERAVIRTTTVDRRSVYKLGHRIFEIGQAYALTTDLVQDGQETTRQLSERSGETAHLAVLDHDHVVYLAKHEGNHAVRMVSVVGQRLPAHGTGVGKVLLAGLEDAEVQRRYGDPAALAPLTPHTITDLPTLLSDLAEIRAAGVAHEQEESSEGVGCVAAPVYNHMGLVAGLSVSVPMSRLPRKRRAELVAQVRGCAESLSIRLGAGSYPPQIQPGSIQIV
ncbi:MAG: IclR family transcriptional regulator [Mycobacteriaceae bacterium]